MGNCLGSPKEKVEEQQKETVPETPSSPPVLSSPSPSPPPPPLSEPETQPAETHTTSSSSSSSSASTTSSSISTLPAPRNKLLLGAGKRSMSLPPQELVKDFRLPDGWKKHADKDLFYNLLTGRETSEIPRTGHGVVIYKDGLPAIADLSKHLEYFSLQHFEEWLTLNEETISSAPPQLKSIEEEFESWTAETGEEEELIPWLLGEQIKLFFSISEALFSSFLPLPEDEKQWESHFKLNDDKLISEKIETLLQNSSSSSIDQLIKIFLQNPHQVKILVEVIKAIFKSQVMMAFIPNKCRFAHESISIQVPFDRSCHKITVNRSKVHPHFCRIIFPAVLGEENDRLVFKALVSK